MSSNLPHQCRLYAILARDGRSAVVFRRGPSRKVLVLRWWLKSDKIELGQWFHGRIYERRCDLSADGELLLYFAAKWRAPIASWTALSRTPYLTALALWPKGDAWGGGGMIDGPKVVCLNHASMDQQLAPGFSLPRNVRVQPVASWAGRGEDNPIEAARLTRSHWEIAQHGEAGEYNETKGYHWVLHTPEIMRRSQPSGAHGRFTDIVLHRELKAVGKQDGPWYVEDYVLRDARGQELRRLVDCSWADFDNSGNLLFADQGKLYRLPKGKVTNTAGDAHENAALVADLANYSFATRNAPDWALRWP